VAVEGAVRIDRMKAVLITLNGKHGCLASPKDFDPLLTQVEIFSDSEFGKDELSAWGREDNEVAVWANDSLQVGDEIVIRVVNAPANDEPLRWIPVLPENRR
jgi:hypothetical protein